MRETMTSKVSVACGSSGNPGLEAAGFERAKDFLIRFFDAVGEWQERAATRRRLASLDNRMLHDIGIDEATAATESAKPFWRC